MDSVKPTKSDTTDLPAVTTLHLDARHDLELERREGGSTLRLVADGRDVALTIEITPNGPVLKVAGPAVTIQAEGQLALDAQQVAICGRESVTISSGGAARLVAQGDLFTEGREQHIKAKLGNVNVKANDDVRLRGERIRLNC